MIDVTEENLAIREYYIEAENQKELADDLLSHFMCILCYGIAIDPFKCAGCETVYCNRCLPDDAVREGHLAKKVPSSKAYKCFKQCGFRDLKRLGRIERNILNSFPFKC